MRILLAVLVSCVEPQSPPEPVPDTSFLAPALRRLTEAQYERTVVDLLGDVSPPNSLEPDTEDAGLLSVGASQTAVSALGVERYENAAYSLARQVGDSPELLAELLPCEPASADDSVCAEAFVRAFGRRAWRRTLTEEEVLRLSSLITEVGTESGTFSEGVVYGLAAMLQSPNFLYRIEYGADTGTYRTLDSWEVATRMSYLLWGTTPDDELLDLAAAGGLLTGAERRAAAARLLDDPRAAEGVGAMFSELFHLYLLESVSKDPTVYTHTSATLGPAARQETLLNLERIYTEDEDFRALLTSTTTYVNPELAALYRVPAPDLENFAEVELSEEGGRRGFLGQASFLMLYAHSTSTSATLRGKFVSQILLCQTVEPPPPGLNSTIPEADATSPTLRQRLANHLTDPACAGCHNQMDPIGLGLEQFDGIGRWRTTENGATIDPSGDLDGVAFSDAWSLSKALRDHDDLMPCLSSHLYRYATGHAVDPGAEGSVADLAEDFAENGSWRELLLNLVENPAFGRTGGLE